MTTRCCRVSAETFWEPKPGDAATEMPESTDSSGEVNPSTATDDRNHATETGDRERSRGQRETGDGNSNKRVRFEDQIYFDSPQEVDTDLQASGQESAVTRKRAAEIDV